MAHWLDEFHRAIERHVPRFATPEDYRGHVQWAVDKHHAARELLAPEHIAKADAHTVYATLKQVCLNVEALPFRITRIADANVAEDIRLGLSKLIATKGTADDKMHAAALPQFGQATLTELLCIYDPHRFVMRSRPTVRGLVKLCGIYTEEHLRDMTYSDYADVVGQMEKVYRQALLAKLDMAEFYLRHKCLLVCLLLTQHAGRGARKRPYA